MENVVYPSASPQHRLGGLAVDIGLAATTGGVGWFIWLLVVMGQGQTPGKQILKLRVYDTTTNKPAKWGHMFIRQIGLMFAINLTQAIFFSTLMVLLGIGIGYIGSLLVLTIFLTDAFWIFKDGKRQRLIDIFLKTDVLNESHISQLYR